MAQKRQGIRKSLRFSVFARDGFTCRYCGRQSDEVKLVIDHVTPVCQGGTNDEANLLTSCEDCNMGKGGKTIAQSAPSEQDRLRILQEHREQMQVHEAALESAKARSELTQDVCNHFCDVFSRDSMSKRTLSVLVRYVEEYGADAVYEWFDIAANKLPPGCSDSRIGRYISGIKRIKLQPET